MFLLASLLFRAPAPEAPPAEAPAPEIAPAPTVVEAPTPGMVPVKAEQVRLATSLHEQSVLTLSLDEGTARGLLRTVDMAALSDSDVWPPTDVISLEADALDGVTKGSWWTLFSEDGQTTCRVTGFAVEIWEAGDPDTMELYDGAPCGSPLFVATLDCQGDVSPRVAVPTENAGRVQIGRYIGKGEAHNGAVMLHPEAEKIHDETVRQAERFGAGDVFRTFEADRFAVGGVEVDVVRGRYYTGEGDNGCGGEDIVRSWTGMSVGGRVVVPRDTTESFTGFLLDLEGDGTIESISSSYTVRTLQREDGTAIRSDDVNYCECGC